ncbi:adenylate kinase [Erysipelotrichaceae bacterium 51-3]
MKRILIIGCAGSGKSTMARKLQKILDIPLIYLDLLWHLPDGSHVSQEEFDKKLASVLSKEAWILDGNYRRTLKERLERCDTVFLLDLPVEVCFEQAKNRIGKPRPDLPWQETEFDPDFQKWILEFPKKNLPEIKKILKDYGSGKTVFVLHSHQEIEDCLQAIRVLHQFEAADEKENERPDENWIEEDGFY